MNKEMLVPVIVIALSVAFLDPFMILMPSMVVYVLLGGLLVSFSIYALHILNESAHDEREEVHRAYAGRMAFIAGSGVLVLGIAYEVLVLHAVDPLLIVALATMAVTKFTALNIVRARN